MSEFPIACQTITFGNDQKEHFPAVFDAVKRAGYEGVEIGFRHVAEMTPDLLIQRLDEAGLALTALHAGGNLMDINQADGERSNLDVTIGYLKMAGAKIMMYSGMKAKDKAEFDKELDMLSRAAESAKTQGISLLYHNHAWEFADDAWIMRGLIEDSSKALGFCPDVGWVYRGGWKITEFLDKIKGRVGAIHFKDFGMVDAKMTFVELGEGEAPFVEATDWIKANTDGIWVIAEQDNSKLPAAEAVAKNAEYLRKVMSEK